MRSFIFRNLKFIHLEIGMAKKSAFILIYLEYSLIVNNTTFQVREKHFTSLES